MKLPLETEVLIPHRKPMRLIELLKSSDGKSGTGETIFDFDSPFVIDSSGKIERLALIELIAQTYAAAKGHEDLADGKNLSDGYLVGISKANFHDDAYAGEKLFVIVQTKDSFDNFFITSGQVYQNEKLLLEASLTILINPESIKSL